MSSLAAQPADTLPLPSDAATAPPPPAARLIYGETPIPANGALLLSGTQGVTVASIDVVSASGQMLSGTLMPIGGNAIWKPDAPLTPGTTITVTLSPPYASSNQPSNVYNVPVTPVRSPVQPALTATLSVERSEKNDRQCCNVLPGFELPAQARCFATQATSFISMTVGLTNTTLTSDLNQFVFKVSAPALMAPGYYLPLQGSYPFRFAMVADQYCFELEAMDIASMQTFTYTDLMPHCQLHGDLGTVGTRAIEVDAAALAHEVCMVPPAAQTKQWCDLNDSACSSNRAAAGCENFGPQCKGEPALQPSNAGASGARAAVGGGAAGLKASAGSAGLKSSAGSAGLKSSAGNASSSTAGVGGGNSATFDHPVQPASASSGCSALGGVRGSPLCSVLCVGLWLLIVRRRAARRWRC